MGTHIRMIFTNDGATPENWEKLHQHLLSEAGTFNYGDDTMFEVEVQASYSYCEEYPNVEGFPLVKGVKWDKWYEERDSDESGTLGGEE
jgi:hypothetical protein